MATTKKARLAGEEGPCLKSRALQVERDWIKSERVRRFDKLQVGKFTRTMDKALPKEHMLKVYKALRQEEAGILSQLRTGHQLTVHVEWEWSPLNTSYFTVLSGETSGPNYSKQWQTGGVTYHTL
jgi:hypothetical protein